MDSHSTASEVDRTLVGLAQSLTGAEHVAITVRTAANAEAVLSSGRRGRLVQNAEFVTGEGPAHDARRVGAVRADGAGLAARWPLFGRIAATLGVTSIAAVALRHTGADAGCLIAFGTQQWPAPPIGRLRRAGDLLAHVVPSPSWGAPHALDVRASVHQAAGMTAHRLSCSVDDAMLLLRARAFADGIDVDVLADEIVAGKASVALP